MDPGEGRQGDWFLEGSGAVEEDDPVVCLIEAENPVEGDLPIPHRGIYQIQDCGYRHLHTWFMIGGDHDFIFGLCILVRSIPWEGRETGPFLENGAGLPEGNTLLLHDRGDGITGSTTCEAVPR